MYAYLRTDNSPYYIGKGSNKRYKESHGGHIAVPKDKSRIVFLESNLTEIGAFALERRYIYWYGRKDIETGILRNLTDGGDGHSGFKLSEEGRKKRSLAHTGKKKSIEHRRNISLARMGKHHSEESKMKISIGQSGANGHFYGKSHSEEVKRKISASAKGKAGRPKKLNNVQQ